MKTNYIASITLLSLGLTMPCAAQTVLQQMETEVSAIAQRTRSAVVTIEDSRALMLAYDTSALERADIESHIRLLEAEQKDAQNQLALIEQRFQAAAIDQLPVIDARTRLAHVEKELAAQRRRLETFGRLSLAQRGKQEAQDQLDLLQLDRQGAAQRLAILEQRFKAGIVDQTEAEAGKLRVQRLNEQIEEATRRRDLYDQQLKFGVIANAGARNIAPANLRTSENAIAGQAANPLGRFYVAAPLSGTGFSIGDGYIVSTADVLAGMSNPVVITDNGAKIRATVIGLDKVLNVGLVKLTAQVAIPALKLGDSAGAVEGHFAISIGNQHGQSNAVALNLIAGLRTEGTDAGEHYYPGLIQIGGTVGAGTSGAPLVDSHGDVIGIIAGVPQPQADFAYSVDLPQLNADGSVNNSIRPYSDVVNSIVLQNSSPVQQNLNAYAAPARGGANGNVTTSTPLRLQNRDAVPPGHDNMFAYWRQPAAPIVTSSGFAIPINDVRNVLAEMKAGKAVIHGWIGVDVGNQEQATEKDGVLTVARSVKVDRVYTAAPAQKGGIQPGDVIISINDRPIHTSGDVRTSIIRLEVGETANVVVRRGTAKQSLKVKVEARPAEYGQALGVPPAPIITTPPPSTNSRNGSQ